MSLFNRRSSVQNLARTSLAGGVCNAVNLLMAFIYRTVFIRLLSVQYLGINGMFTNLLDLMSLAELGITAAISYRMYKPISQGDSESVGQLMRLYQRIYRRIAGLILLFGLALLPFLPYFVQDAAEIPKDINLQLIYLLYLARTVVSYLFVYKLTLLTADQREYIRTLTDAAARIVIYMLQIISLLIWHSFTLSLLVAIGITLLENILFSHWVGKRYPAVFTVRALPDRATQRAVFHEMLSGGYHRVGAVILTSTDQLVLVRFAGLAASGLYANYSMIMNALKSILLQLMGSGTASLGNARVSMDDAANQRLYEKLLTLNLFLSGLVSFCLFGLINDFIGIWLGESCQLSMLTVTVLCIQFYLDTGRFITDAYINGCGLFVRDRWRPFAEAAINLTVSVLLVIRYGITGVFIGTIVSFAVTAFWRAPLILCRYGLHCDVKRYWHRYLAWLALPVLAALLMTLLSVPVAAAWSQWLMKAVACSAAYLMMVFVLTIRDPCVKQLLADARKLWIQRLQNKKL